MKDSYHVEAIEKSEIKPWLLHKHYMKRMTCVTYAYGLFDQGGVLQGVCTYGNALPMQMRRGFCGEDNEDLVYELNRLCVNDDLPRNTLSFFVSQTLKKIPHPKIIASYSEPAKGHYGYIYQATNFLFTGTSHSQLDWKLKGREDIHSRTLMDEFAFEKNRIEKLKEKYGNRLYQELRPPKNRYVYFCGTKSQRKVMLSALRYPVLKYPKGINVRYESSYKPAIQACFVFPEKAGRLGE